MRMRTVVPALVEIAAPALAAHFAQRAGVMLKDGKWREKIEMPCHRYRDLRIDYSGQGGPHFNPMADLGGQARAFLESTRHPLRVLNVIAEMRAAGAASAKS